jgi:hypothetical protein
VNEDAEFNQKGNDKAAGDGSDVLENEWDGNSDNTMDQEMRN